jgi:hypothetical protein
LFDEFLLDRGGDDATQLVALLIVALYFTAASIDVHYDTGATAA